MLLPHRPCPSRAQRGHAILAVTFLALVLAGLAVGLNFEVLADRRSISHQQTSQLALELAEAGLVRAEMELITQLDASTDGLGDISGALGQGTYAVVATQVAGSGGAEQLWTLRSTGSQGLSVRRIEVRHRLVTSKLFAYALFARRDLVIDSSVSTDSFDSRLGTYASQATRTDALGKYADATGHIGSNANIQIRSSVRIRGDAVPGPTNTTTLVGSSCYVAGDKTPRGDVFDVPDPPLSEFQAAFASNRNADIVPSAEVSYSGATRSLFVDGSAIVTLRGGTYFFKDFVFNGSSQLRVTAPCKIYVTGRLELLSSVLANSGGYAKDLLFFAHPYNMPGVAASTTAQVVLNSSLKASLAIYAPARDVVIDSSIELSGAIVGRGMTINSSARIHYDRALSELQGFGGIVSERVYWREPSLPPR